MWDDTNLFEAAPTPLSASSFVDLVDAYVRITCIGPNNFKFTTEPNDYTPRYKNGRKVKEFRGTVYLNGGEGTHFEPKAPDKYENTNIIEWSERVLTAVRKAAADYIADPLYIQNTEYWTQTIIKVAERVTRDLKRFHESLLDDVTRYSPYMLSSHGGSWSSQGNFGERRLISTEGKLAGIIGTFSALAGIYVDVDDIVRKMLHEEWDQQ